jgi:cytoskeleton protein RodZ
MQSLGQRLRAERERRGLTIEELAQSTRIHVRYFRAIEEDDLSALPGGFFYRSFLRQYARLLGLPDSVVEPAIQQSLDSEVSEMDARQTALPERNIDLPPIPTGSSNTAEEAKRWMLRLGVLIGVVVLSTGAYELYRRWRIVPPAAQRADRMEPPAPTSAAPAAPAAVPPAVPGPTLPPPQAAEPPPQPAPGPAAGVRVTVTAVRQCWVDIWEEGKRTTGDLLRPGQSRTFTAQKNLRIRFGNAGGVTLEWNGRALPAPGAEGHVWEVEFTETEFHPVLLAPKPAPPAAALPQQG